MTLKFPNLKGYQIVSELGSGGYSTVYRAVHMEDRTVVACKLVRLTEQTTSKQRKEADKELRIHSQMRHKHVLRYFDGLVLEPSQAAKKYVPGIYMMLELAAGGDLFDKIAPDVGVSDDVAHLYFNQLLSGMEYIHGEGVCHRDLKPENILLDVAGALKICDFGLAAVYKLKETGQTRMLSEQCGSLPYAAPELSLRNTIYSGEAVDVWGMGVILFTLLAGNTPWDQATTLSPEYCSYLDGTIYDQDPWNRFDNHALSLLQGLLNTEPRDRFTIADAIRHPWCIRQSQLACQSTAILADRLTENLRKNGDLAYVTPVLSGTLHDVDNDGDAVMQSQFTQSLLLFSQTQAGARYTPHLTRFYAKLSPTKLYNIIKDALLALNVQVKVPGEHPKGMMRLRIGGFDRRKEMFKGWVEIEHFQRQGLAGSFVVMHRDVGNPISWRQLWKALIKSPTVEEHVYRKR